MFKRNQFQNAVLFAAATLASSAVIAQQVESTQASVTVQNAFVITEDAALSFGTITASTTSPSISSIIINPDGSAGAPGSGGGIRVLVPGNAASYTISGAAPFTDLKTKMGPASSSITLTNAVAPPGNPDFTVSKFSLQQPGETAVTIDSATLATFTTDANGELVLNLGAELALPIQDKTLLTDGLYEGTFQVSIEY